MVGSSIERGDSPHSVRNVGSPQGGEAMLTPVRGHRNAKDRDLEKDELGGQVRTLESRIATVEDILNARYQHHHLSL